MPVVYQLLDLSVALAGLFICSEYSVSLSGVLLTENVDDLSGLAGVEHYFGLKCAAGVAVVVALVVAESALYRNGVAVGSVRSDKAVEVAVVSGNARARYAEESLSPVRAVSVLAAVFVDVLYYLVALERCSGDEEGVL